MKKKTIANSDSKSLPPKLPGATAELERVIVLLGNRVQADLKQKSKTELIQLIDAYPDETTAALWKQCGGNLRTPVNTTTNQREADQGEFNSRKLWYQSRNGVKVLPVLL